MVMVDDNDEVVKSPPVTDDVAPKSIVLSASSPNTSTKPSQPSGDVRTNSNGSHDLVPNRFENKS